MEPALGCAGVCPESQAAQVLVLAVFAYVCLYKHNDIFNVKANIYIIAAAIVALAASCLGDGGNTIMVGNYPGVVEKHGDSVYIYLKGNELVYVPRGAGALNHGEAVLIDFLLDHSLPENADSGRIKGYLTIDLQRASSLPQYALTDALNDTSKAIQGERMLSSVLAQNAFIRDRFFLYTNHPADSLPLQFNMYCDLQSPRTDGVYDLYLRISPAEGLPAAQPLNRAIAFDISKLSSRETDSLFFRILYVNRINAQAPALSWSSTEVYRFGI
jgi:hypothetical protein